MTLTDDFLATLAGAAVAGVIGLVTLLTQQWLADRRQLNEQILAPAFNYVLSLPNSWPWEGLSEPDWSKIDSYHWLKVRAKFRFPLVELSARLEAHSKAYQRYSEFMLETGQASFSKSICEGLSKYVNPQDSSISAQSIGIEGRAIIELRLVVWGLIPDVLTNHDNPDRAWNELSKASSGQPYWACRIVQALQKIDPPSLQRIFEEIWRNPDSPRARTLVESARQTFDGVVEQAEKVRIVLAKRLGVGASIGDRTM